MTAMSLSADDVIRFWFEEAEVTQWFSQSDDFDQRIRERFGHLLEAAARCELFAWRHSAPGCLAEVLVLDQFSRNVFRGGPQAFAQDALALGLAQSAVAAGLAAQLTTAQRACLYLPYMHSESLLIHEEAVRLFSAPGMERNLDFEQRHKAIIERFGRYPHRNAALGRESTAEETPFLATPGASV